MNKFKIILLIFIILSTTVWAVNEQEIGTVNRISVSATDSGYVILKIKKEPIILEETKYIDGEATITERTIFGIPDTFYLKYHEVSNFQNQLKSALSFDELITSSGIITQFSGLLHYRVIIVNDNVTVFCFMYTNKGNTTAHFTFANLYQLVEFSMKSDDLNNLFSLLSKAKESLTTMKNDNATLAAALYK